MIKKDLVNLIIEREGLTPFKAANIVNGIFTAIKESLAKGNRVDIRRFGNFTPIVRKAKKARNVKRKEFIIVPEHNFPKFIPSKELKAMMNPPKSIF